MIHQMSGKIASLFSERKIIKSDMKEVYAYGLELLIATLITGLIILGLSIVFCVFSKTILLLIPFIIIRSNAGGYHAETHFKCILSFTITYLLAAWLLYALPVGLYAVFSAVSLITSLITVLSFGSIPNKNRPVTPTEKRGFDKKCRFLSFVLSAVGFALTYFIPKYGVYFSTGILMAASSMIVGKIILMKEKKK